MAISRLDMNRQLYDKGGIITLEDAKKMAPPGESLAYINPEEAALLKSLGGAGEDVNGTGIKSYFIKKISDTKSFNLDEELLFLEFEEEFLNG